MIGIENGLLRLVRRAVKDAVEPEISEPLLHLCIHMYLLAHVYGVFNF